MQSTKPASALFKRSDRWPIALTLLAGALVLSVPVILIGGMLYLASNYLSILNEATEIDARPEQSTMEK